MANSTRPRKRYRPKPVTRPVLREMRDKLILPAYAALEVLRASADQGAREGALVDLQVLVEYCGRAASAKWNADAMLDDINAARQALAAIKARHGMTGRWGATGPELNALRDATIWCDQALPMLDTAVLTTAIVEVGIKAAVL